MLDGLLPSICSRSAFTCRLVIGSSLVPVVGAYRELGLGSSGGIKRGGCAPMSITTFLRQDRCLVYTCRAVDSG
jgi:hypothetical protein